MSTADQLQTVREAIADVRAADDCADYKVRVHQLWHGDALIASAVDLPHWVVLAGLQAMERELVAQLANKEISVESALPMAEGA